MKGCELCRFPARMYCDADGASLCWGCDEKVHSANFLVAKHSRNLVCHVCQSPTPWKASGPKLTPTTTLSVCHTCVHNYYSTTTTTTTQHDNIGGTQQTPPLLNEDDDETSTEYDEEEYEDSEVESDGDDEEELEDQGENQVVPWSSTPLATSSSPSDEEHQLSSCTSFSAAPVCENAHPNCQVSNLSPSEEDKKNKPNDSTR
ncbi:zinc finger protein CONSTANS-LIKE 4-like [Cornus florida]|uniref:zinc finger protein CONSTANS-LIKE 4-like n=1 Tax=Cornus florida TaxID=4283 RepID=UPI0028A1F905|nr:zinc finger protein CONSTANS-LIKE 4-like [Cornus florida]